MEEQELHLEFSDKEVAEKIEAMEAAMKDLDNRLGKLEAFTQGILKVAAQHPMGKIAMSSMGIDIESFNS
jgi:archaellum component FlaC